MFPMLKRLIQIALLPLLATLSGCNLVVMSPSGDIARQQADLIIVSTVLMLLIIVPVFIPTANALGIDPVHFGVVAVVNAMIGLITPPYGLLLFIVSNITNQPVGRVIREVWPFILALFVALGVITFVPDFVLWFPRLLGYQG